MRASNSRLAIRSASGEVPESNLQQAKTRQSRPSSGLREPTGDEGTYARMPIDLRRRATGLRQVDVDRTPAGTFLWWATPVDNSLIIVAGFRSAIRLRRPSVQVSMTTSMGAGGSRSCRGWVLRTGRGAFHVWSGWHVTFPVISGDEMIVSAVARLVAMRRLICGFSMSGMPFTPWSAGQRLRVPTDFSPLPALQFGSHHWARLHRGLR